MSLVSRSRGSSLMSSTRGGMARGVPAGQPAPSASQPAAARNNQLQQHVTVA